MATDLDFPPVYDALIKEQVFMSDIWINFISSLIQTISEYLTQNGIIIPTLTTQQRDLITSPPRLIIYNSSLGEYQVWKQGAWKNILTT